MSARKWRPKDNCARAQPIICSGQLCKQRQLIAGLLVWPDWARPQLAGERASEREKCVRDTMGATRAARSFCLIDWRLERMCVRACGRRKKEECNFGLNFALKFGKKQKEKCKTRTLSSGQLNL